MASRGNAHPGLKDRKSNPPPGDHGTDVSFSLETAPDPPPERDDRKNRRLTKILLQRYLQTRPVGDRIGAPAVNQISTASKCKQTRPPGKVVFPIIPPARIESRMRRLIKMPIEDPTGPAPAGRGMRPRCMFNMNHHTQKGGNPWPKTSRPGRRPGPRV